MSTYDAVKDLPLEIEGYELEPLEREVARGFTLRRTVVVLRGGGEEGRGEEVDYDPDAQQRFQARRGELPFAGRHTLDSFSRPPVGADRVPPLGVRVGGARPRAAAGRALARRGARARGAAAPLRRLDPRSRTSRAGSRSTPSCTSSSTPTATGRDETVATLAGRGRRRHRRLQGHLPRASSARRRIPSCTRASPRRSRRRGSRIPALTPETLAALEPHRDRITWDAAIHEWSDVEALPFRPRCLNCEAVALRIGASGCSTSTTRASARASRSTAAASSSSAPAATRSSCSPRSSTPTRRTTSRRPGYNATEPDGGPAGAAAARAQPAAGLPSLSAFSASRPTDSSPASPSAIPLRALARVTAADEQVAHVEVPVPRLVAACGDLVHVEVERPRRRRVQDELERRSPRAPRAARPPRARRRSARRGRRAAGAVPSFACGTRQTRVAPRRRRRTPTR